MFTKTIFTSNTSCYTMGKPFTTGALTAGSRSAFSAPGPAEAQPAGLPYFESSTEKNSLILTYIMEENDKVFGLGEQLGGLNKRGKEYRLYNTDDPLHSEEKSSLYSSHPFLMIKGKNTFGLFIDYPGELFFDIGFTDFNTLTITVPSCNVDIYLFDTPVMTGIIKEYLQLTGAPYVPPKWAFGFQQCRWSYPDSKTVEKITDTFREQDIPCDTIYIDIDYMDNYKVFTIDDTKFPDFESFTAGLKKKGFKLVAIIDPGVRIEPGYDVYEEGIKGGHFCTGKNGLPYTTAVWPGLVHFPDFFQPKTQTWFGGYYKRLIDKGVDGFWNDMNEPTVFYTPEKYKGVQEKIAAADTKDFENCWNFFSLRDDMNKLTNHEDYYKEFYHTINDGSNENSTNSPDQSPGKNERVTNHEVHNLYGYQMARAFTGEYTKNNRDKRYFLLSRSSYAGMHRMAAIWMGDNMSWWEHMKVNIQMLISLNMCGFFFTGADIGGFGANTSAELTIRWMQLGIFSPLYRNHSALGTRNQEPFAFDEAATSIIKQTLKLRYALLPYLYSEFMLSVKNLFPFISSPALHFEDPDCLDVEDQFMAGSSLMAAPIYEKNARGRYLYLPGTKWLFWNVRSYEDYTMQVLEPGRHYINCGLDQIPLFIKENSLVVTTGPSAYTGEKPLEELTVIGFVTRRASYTFYDDDGETTAYREGKHGELLINVEKNGPGFSVTAEKGTNSYQLTVKTVHFKIYDETGSVYKKTIKL